MGKVNIFFRKKLTNEEEYKGHIVNHNEHNVFLCALCVTGP